MKGNQVFMVNISIIIPVYNKEKFLQKCIDSILKQTYTDIEIILIDDGSIDKSKEIISEYVTKYPKIIHSIEGEHRGVGNARNQGLKKAKGKYILFVDADDYLKPDYLINLMKFSNFEFVVSGLLEQIYGLKHITTSIETGNVVIDVNSGNVNSLFSKKFFPIFSVVYTKLFKKEIIDKYHLTFKDLQYGEDTLFVLEYLKYVEKIKIISYAGYINLIVENTLSRNYVNNIWEYVRIIPDEVNGHNKNWQFLFVRSIKLTLLNDASTFRNFKKQCDIITSDSNFKFASIFLLKSWTDKIILLFLKLKSYWPLFIAFKSKAN